MTNTTQPRFQQNRTSDFKQYLSFDKKFGYLHEIRVVPTQRSKTYTARISVPVGQGDQMNYVNFELYIKSADALIAFTEHSKRIADDNVKVTVRFSCNNTHPRAYVAKNGKREGEAIPYMGGHLSYLHTMKIDGKTVYGYMTDEDLQEDKETVDKETGEVIARTDHSGEADGMSGEVIPLMPETTKASSVQNEPPKNDEPPVDVYEEELGRQLADSHDVNDSSVVTNGKMKAETQEKAPRKRVPKNGSRSDANTKAS